MSSGASSAAGAATAEPPEPLALRLIGRGSLAGAAIVMAIALVYAVIVPAVADSVSAPAPPRIVEIGGGATVSVTDDWSVAAASPGVTTLTQGGASLVITVPHESDLHPAQAIDGVIDEWLSAGQGEIAVAPSPRAFTTDAGDDAVTVALQDPLRSGQAWVVSDGSRQVVALLTTPQAGWEAASASAQTVIRSLELPAEPS
ncbi:hypothetical protein [Demequina iriomotensis]|uniref:hypothetical protein n=1 Tax=Demequina iriomotensis TaxID=1536641 RepID=UPI00078591A1|nr:hypothetical protein [Demequina iriomotensis]